MFYTFQLFDETQAHTTCSVCKDPKKEVSVRCIDCNLFLCDPCHKSHDGFQPMQSHQIINIEVSSSQTLTPVSTSADRVCREHDGEAKRFYCETCSKPVCRDCIVMKQFCRDHEYTSLKEASRKQVASLIELTRQCEMVKTKCQEALKKTEQIESKFESAVKEEKEKAEKMKQEITQECTRQIESMFKNFDTAVGVRETQRVHEFKRIMDNIQTTLAKIENACVLSTNVTQMGTFYDISSMHATLSKTLKEIAENPAPAVAHEKLGEGLVRKPVLAYPKLQKEIFNWNNVWTLVKQFSTCPTLKKPRGIAVSQEGKIALTDHDKHAAVFSMSGDLELTLEGPFVHQLYDVAITPDNRYILPANNGILSYDSRGVKEKLVNEVVTHKGKTTHAKTVAVDSAGRIVAGLDSCTITIQNSEGSEVSTFRTPSRPRFLAITPRNEIAVTYQGMGGALKITDYDGNDSRDLKPQNIIEWNPAGVCCSEQGELFVVNNGNPCDVFKLSADGKEFLRCALSGLDDPQGIAITADGQQLLLTEKSQSLVKIYQRY